MTGTAATALFEQARPGLLGLAYRMLGSRADAEDAVQDTYLKWHHADRATVDNPHAWLTTVCTRRCLDLLKSRRRGQAGYVGEWLPEPLEAAATDGDSLLLAASLSTAFLLMLERLSPKERAAYLLHEIFDTSYEDTGRTLGISESACRKLVSRARDHVAEDRVRQHVPVDRQDALLAAFREAVATGGTARLAALVTEDIELRQDTGGKVPATVHTLRGSEPVLAFIGSFLHRVWQPYRWTVADLNGGRGVLLGRNGKAEAALSFAYDDAGRVRAIFIVRNPDKLARLGPA